MKTTKVFLLAALLGLPAGAASAGCNPCICGAGGGKPPPPDCHERKATSEMPGPIGAPKAAPSSSRAGSK